MNGQRLFLGGYGNGLIRWDWRGESAERPVRFDAPIHPSYGVFNASETRLYIVSERDAVSGAVAEYSVDTEGSVTLQEQWETSGGAPCHVCLTPSGQWLATANYAGGSVDLFRIKPDGGLCHHSCIRHCGKGLDPARQEAPHTHFVRFLTDDLLCVIDLGLDALRLYRVPDGAEDGLTATLENELGLKPGCGPRHLTVCAESGLLYLVCELQPELYTLCLENGALRVIHRMSLRPEGYADPVYLSGVRVSFAKRHVYAALRGANRLASVSLLSEGIPEAVRFTDCGGKTPREIALSPDDRRLLCANQDSNLVTVFEIRPNGDIGTARQSLSVPSPAWIGFWGRET